MANRVTYDTTVPEDYWPQPDKPWRVSWGFGVFEDFATQGEAQAKHDELKRELKGDWRDTIDEPYNAYEMWAPQRIEA